MAYLTWSFDAGAATARDDVAEAVRAVLKTGTLHAWASAAPNREAFRGRATAFGVELGPVRAVVRHAHRGGYVIPPILGDRFFGRSRFLRELEISERLREAGVRTPAFLAGVRYDHGPFHRADVATERVDGTDLFTLVFGPVPLPGEVREMLLRAVARAVRRLHDAGWVHEDLQLRNVLVSGPRSPSPDPWFLDVDTCRPARGEGDRRANLRRFFRSWAKWNARQGARLGPDDVAIFNAAYLAT